MLSIAPRPDGFDLCVDGRFSRRLVATRYGWASSKLENGQLPLFAQTFWPWTDFFAFRCRAMSLACTELHERYKGEAYRAAASRAAPVNRQAMEQVKEAWNRHKAKAPAEVLAVQRAVKRMSGVTRGVLLAAPEVYDGYLAKDLVAVPGAAAMVGVVECLTDDRYSVRVYDPPTHREPLDELDCYRWVEAPPPPVSKLVSALEGWPGLCAPDACLNTPDADVLRPGTPYTSLSKTLARLPAGVPSSMLVGLRSVWLERPLVSKLSLAAVSTMANPPETETFEWDDPGGKRQLAAVRRMMHASDDDLAYVVAEVARLLNKPLSPRRVQDIETAVTFVASAAVHQEGPVRSLVRKAFIQGRAPKPPLPPPDATGVRLLRTAEEVAEEGRDMRHCVATRVQNMLAGRTYLFAVKRRSSRATVEVSAEGEVVQARGPANSTNAASRWGRTVLEAWAAPLRARAERKASHKRRRLDR